MPAGRTAERRVAGAGSGLPGEKVDGLGGDHVRPRVVSGTVPGKGAATRTGSDPGSHAGLDWCRSVTPISELAHSPAERGLTPARVRDWIGAGL